MKLLIRNEMLKYYYDCPIKAAWMAKYFGMKFEGGYAAQFLALDAASQIRDKNERDYYYIHPDSLHLLEPREGDLVKATWVGKGAPVSQCLIYNAIEVLGSYWHIGKIIQRNGIPFMWPEQE